PDTAHSAAITSGGRGWARRPFNPGGGRAPPSPGKPVGAWRGFDSRIEVRGGGPGGPRGEGGRRQALRGPPAPGPPPALPNLLAGSGRGVCTICATSCCRIDAVALKQRHQSCISRMGAIGEAARLFQLKEKAVAALVAVEGVPTWATAD